MGAGSRIGLGGVAMAAAALAFCGCGGGSDSTAVDETASPRPKPPPAVVAHRIGPRRVEPGEQHLPARPCNRLGENGTTTVVIYSDNGPCVRAKPGERLRFVNETGIGPGHKGAKTVRIRIGDYRLRLEPRGSGLVPGPVESYLGRGAHRVLTAGGRGATILLLPAVCAVRPPVDPGEEPCFR
jgi:hypothetical protein